MRELTVSECLSVAWTTFKARPWLFVLAGLTLLAVNIVVSVPDRIFNHMSDGQVHATGTLIAVGVAGVLSSLFKWIVSVYISMGTRNFTLKAHDEVQVAEIRDLIFLRGFWRYLGMNIVFFVGFVVGIILLIVPGIILAIGWSFAPYLVIEQGAGPIDALKRSWELTRGNRWTLFLLGLALIGINILGFCALIVGLFVTVPVSWIAGAHAYRVLLKARTKGEGSVETVSTDAPIVPATA